MKLLIRHMSYSNYYGAVILRLEYLFDDIKPERESDACNAMNGNIPA